MANRDRKNLDTFSSKFKTRKHTRGDARPKSDNDRKREDRRKSGRRRKMASQNYDD